MCLNENSCLPSIYLRELDPLLKFPDYPPTLGNQPDNRTVVNGWVLIYLLTYLLTYLLHGTESFLRS